MILLPFIGGVMAGSDETRINGSPPQPLLPFRLLFTFALETLILLELPFIGLLLPFVINDILLLLKFIFSSAWRPSNVELYDLNSVYLGDIIVLLVAKFVLVAGSSEVGELKSNDSRDLKIYK